METRGRSVFWKRSSLFLVSLCLFGAAASQAAECRNQIEILGGSTAIMRGKAIETVADLQEAFNGKSGKKYREAIRQILARAKLSDRYKDVMEKIAGLKETDLISHAPGTEFEWMAFRHKSDKSVDLLRNSCWEGAEGVKAWTFKLSVDKEDRVFIIPVKCLNLALLKDKPPTCELTARAECSEKPARITITADAKAQGESKIQNVDLKEAPSIPDGKKKPDAWEWTFDDVKSGSYRFTAVATDDKKFSSPECTTTVVVCVKPPEPPQTPCEPASCQLKASGTWPEDAGMGTLTISADGTVAESAKLTITPPGGEPEILTSFKEPISKSEPAGDYTISLVAKSKDERCKEAVCTTTVTLKPPPPHPPLCCESLWYLRAYGAFAQAEGSEEHGTLQSTYLGTGTYKFHFNQGIGFGFELERRFENSNLGWTFGLFQADLDTLWVSDSYSTTSGEHWIFDHDRTPLRTLTTGLNVHARHDRWDFFAGPVIGYATIGDITYADGSAHPGTTRASFDDSFVYGVNLGFDAWVGRCWGFTGGAEYLKVSAKSRILDVDVDPLILKFGVVYHF